MSGRDVVLATRSVPKIRELRALLESGGFTVTDLATWGLVPSADEEALESFATFEQNALAKARFFYEATGGIATIADDSGLEVAALGGRPGVRSKRWSERAGLEGPLLDEANNQLLMRELCGVTDRRARYVCAVAYVSLGIEIVRRGETRGHITGEAVGGGGFGYDPYFHSDDLGMTFAEAVLRDKQRVSHRARAIQALVDALRQMR
ncbi:MAG: RdgB/HAM1 family non-canonical purine NTP pyrophosphatase [Vulcanimicrobiaceae bacterium]